MVSVETSMPVLVVNPSESFNLRNAPSVITAIQLAASMVGLASILLRPTNASILPLTWKAVSTHKSRIILMVPLTSNTLFRRWGLRCAPRPGFPSWD